MKKLPLIQKINNYFTDNNIVEESINLQQLDKSFEASTGKEEGYITITELNKNSFIYIPSGELEEIESHYSVLSYSDLRFIYNLLITL